MLDKKFKNKREQKLSATKAYQRSIALEDTVLDAIFLYDQEMQEFLMSCRVFLSFISFKSKTVDESIFQEIQDYACAKFLPTLLKRYNEDIWVANGSVEESITSKPSVGSPNFFQSKQKKLSQYFESALTQTIKGAIRRRNFAFDPLIATRKVPGNITSNIAFIKCLRQFAQDFITQIQGSQATKNLLQHKCQKIIEIIEPHSYRNLNFQEQHFNPMRLVRYTNVFALSSYGLGYMPPDMTAACLASSLLAFLFLVAQLAKNRQDNNTDIHKNLLYSLLFSILLYETETLSFKGSLSLFFVFLAIFFLYDVKVFNDRMAGIKNVIYFLSPLQSVKRKKCEINESGFVFARDIMFEEMTDDTEDSEKELKKTSAEEKQLEPIRGEEEELDYEFKKQKIKRRPDFVVTYPDEKKSSLQKSNAICFESMGPSAKYDPDDVNHSTVFPCEIFGLKNVFVHIAAGILADLEGSDKQAADKFQELVKAPRIASAFNKQGIKILRGKYIQLHNGELTPCFELKPLGKQKNKRLVACMESVEVDHEHYQLIVFRVFVPHAHQGKALEQGIQRLATLVNKESAPAQSVSLMLD